MSATKLIVASPAEFGRLAAHPFKRDDVTTKSPDHVLETLSRLFMDSEESWPAKDECVRLIAAREKLNRQCEQFISKQLDGVREQVTQALEVAKERARAAQKAIADFEADIWNDQAELNRLNDAQAKAYSLHRDALNARANLSRFAARETIRRADENVRAAEKRLDAARAKCSELQSKINQKILVGKKPLAEELDACASEVSQLEHFLTGKGFTNDLGIVVPSSEPL